MPTRCHPHSRSKFRQDRSTSTILPPTLALLDLNAIVGVKGKLLPTRTLSHRSASPCALRHSTVDNSFSPGIGKRLRWLAQSRFERGGDHLAHPRIFRLYDVARSHDATVRRCSAASGPGKFDAELILDGKGSQARWQTAATCIPAAYGLAGVNLHTYTGWGSIPYWNAFVAISRDARKRKVLRPAPRRRDATQSRLARNSVM